MFVVNFDFFNRDSTANLPSLRLRTSKFSSGETYVFPKKNPVFWTYWEFLLLQSLWTANVLQVDEKNHTQNHPMMACSRELNWQTSAKKRTFLRGKFLFHIFKKMKQNINNRVRMIFLLIYFVLENHGKKIDCFSQSVNLLSTP